MKILLILFLSFFSLFAQNNVIKYKNALAINELIKAEEKIALNYEKYLLTELKKPSSLNDLIDDKYLGSNFSVKNPFGSSSINFISINDMKLKFLVTKVSKDSYIYKLYTRDLNRDRTNATTTVGEDDLTKESKFYIKFELKSKVAQNILKILNDGYTILNNSDCKNSAISKVNKYCDYSEQVFRWYNSSSKWVEYDKEKLNHTNVTIQDASLINESILDDQVVGTFIYVQNGNKFLQLVDGEKRLYK